MSGRNIKICKEDYDYGIQKNIMFQTEDELLIRRCFKIVNDFYYLGNIFEDKNLHTHKVKYINDRLYVVVPLIILLKTNKRTILLKKMAAPF